MNADKQRIAIAEACGWCPAQEHPVMGKVWTPPNWRADANHYPISSLPDYLNDLNAMHEAEKVMVNEIDWRDFRRHLMKTLEPHRHELHATAAQRAEAFLRTIGKWEKEAK